MTIENSRQTADRVAREARRRAESNEAAERAARIREQAASISPQAAATLGPALDPAAGFSLDPNARPADLPEPGSAPGGAEKRRVGNVFAGHQMADEMAAAQQPSGTPSDGLVDDHDALVGSGIGGTPQTPQQPPQQPQRPATKPGPVRQQHPVLSQLREDLGIESIEPVDVVVGGHTWTLCTLTPGDIATASRLADRLATGRVEASFVYQTAIVAHAVMAIDRVPAYQVFGIEVPPNVVIRNPLRPPRSVRALTAGALFDFIQEEGRTQLSDKLFAAYNDKSDPAGEVKSYLDDPMNRKLTFACEVEDCDHTVTMTPRYRPGTRDVVLPFCQWHATPMKVTDETESSSPLP